MTLYTGQLLQNRYQIVRLLARGGMGAVYLAADMRLGGRHCAIKELLPDPKATPEALNQLREQFKVEARTLAHLEHPNLPNVFDHFSDSGNEYLVMDYIEGKNLEDVLTEQGAPLSESLVLTWAEQVLSALELLHTHQPHAIIHRDIKPSNIILQASGQIKIVDFGLVKLLEPSKSSTALIVRGMGTPEYTPLEQYGTTLSHTDARSDIYALGATLYHLLTNVPPANAQQRFVNPQALLPLRKYNPQLSARTEAAILKAMAMAPNQRFQSIQEFRAALFAAPIDSTILSAKPTIRIKPPTTSLKSKKAGLIPLLAALAMILLLLILMMLLRLPFWGSEDLVTPDTDEALISEDDDDEPASSKPTVTPTVGCLLQSEFIKDVTIPDGSSIEAGESFIKTWRIRNSGDCDWPLNGHRVVFTGGEQLGPVSIAMPAAKVGQEVDISLEMQAPSEPGNYRGTWELWNEKGEPYGYLTVMINVPAEEDNLSGQGETRLAFTSERDGNGEIYIQEYNGSFKRLTNNSAGDWKPTWSPDGSLIAFESERDKNYEIYRMNSNGSNQINLTNHPDNDSWPAWSSTGYIAFQSNRDKNWEIYLMNSEGGNLINLTNTRTHELQPAWSPNGQQIAFISSTSVESELWDIYVMNSDGTNRRQLTTYEGADMHPAWSPDGNQIAFTSYRDGNFEIYIMNSDGTSQKRLTTNPEANDLQPAWHPTGTSLTFTSNLNGTDNEIYLINLINRNDNSLNNLTKSAGDDRWSAWWR